MRTNLPVTGKEVVMKDDEIIVSKTNLKGQITYVNQTFLDISGFTEKECLGEPHNMVRHPDMPAEAFADLWNCLKEGRPWSGYVKNRCKNGDHYWVRANACPIFENGQVTGYMSVREKPTREMVDAHERAYAALRSGKSGLVIEDGQAFKNNKITLALRRVTIAQRALFAVGVVLIFMLAMSILGLRDMRLMSEAITAMNEEHVQELTLLNAVGALYAVNIVDTAHKARNGNLTYEKAQKSIGDAKSELAKLWPPYAARTDHPPEERVVIDKITADMKKADVLVGELESALRANDDKALATLTIDKLYPAIDPVGDQIAAMQSELIKGANEETKRQMDVYQELRVQFIIALIAATLIGIFLALRLVKSIRGPIDAAQGYFRRFAEGKMDVQINIGQRDEVSKVLEAAKTMQVKLGFDIVEQKRVGDEMTRIKIALDNVSTGVMIADGGRNIIYANHSVKKILKGAESAIKKQLPNFDADNMVGVNIDTFHKNPKHQADMLASFTTTYVANLQISERHMRVTASPVFNDRGERLGAVAEWLDRTQEVSVEQEVANLVSGAAAGDLSQRISMEGKDGFFAQLGTGLNQLVSVTESAIKETSTILSQVAQGDLTQTVDADLQGMFGQLKDDTNTTIHRLREVIGQIKEATDLINTAAKEIAAGNTDLSSRTEEQASSLEETASSMEELNSTVKQNAENAGQANGLARSSNETAVKSGQMVQQIVTTMNGISQSSKKIADIIGVIDSIAFQTNILALNAAVEAARAGEQGRGFAVVATEVRNLAQRSATAAKEIKELIAESTGQVDAGTRLVDQAGVSMTAVVTSFQQVTGLVTDIANASREQASGIEQVTQAVGQMDEVTQQNAALVEQAAAAAESLEEQARALVQAVSMFKLDEGSGRQMPGPALRNAPAQKQLAPRAPAKPGPATAQSSGRKLPPPHLANDNGDEWEEF
jgi:methyl-accepting chemotaxis protein